MGNTCKRFLAVLLTVLLMSALCIVGYAEETDSVAETGCYLHGDVNADGSITSRDAIYVLYNTFLPEDYPITQERDLNEDGQVSSKDAIWLLYASFGQNPLKGTIHSYFDPVWNWTKGADGTMTAEVTFNCGCSEEHDPITATVSSETVAPTCVAAGSVTYTAVATFEGQEIAATKTETIPATADGHTITGTPTCEAGVECESCDYKISALGHAFALESTTPATCSSKAVEHYACANEGCDATKDVTLEGQLEHTYKLAEEGVAEKVEGTTCQWIKVNTYKCVCDETKQETVDAYYVHTYTVTLTTEPTCVATGVRTYTCDDCDNSYTETVEVNPNAHSWDAGTTSGDVITYTCTLGCGATKTAVAMTDAGLTTEALAQDEVKLDGGTTVSLDAVTLAGLEENKENQEEELSIKITVEPANVNGLLNEEQLEQVGGNTVYDFNMTYSDGTPVSEFAGKVTVSLPYTLQADDDIDSIDVWYIDDNGNLAQMSGTYSNGYVTFTTDHFSYYTVTRLTPAQRCARYGHILVDANKPATCTDAGYSLRVCQRCGEEQERVDIAATGHKYEETGTAATCEAAGESIKVCAVEGCGHKITATIPAAGHSLTVAETAATCTEAGKKISTCANCDYVSTEESPALGHSFELEELKATCTNNGHQKDVCTVCGAEEIIVETGATGHHYSVGKWEWNEDYTKATCTLVCAYTENHTKTLNAVITKKETSATCLGSGAVTYTATASFNKFTYTDVQTITLEAVDHQHDNIWHTNANQHYHVCGSCESKLDAADHNWNAGTVTKEATCSSSGTKVFQCTICGYEKEVTITATGVHSFVNGVCSVCGFTETSCTHVKMLKTDLDLSGYDICDGAQVQLWSCDCGEKSYVKIENLNCTFGESTTREEISANGTEYTIGVHTCTTCGLVYECCGYEDVSKDPCACEYTEIARLILDGTVIADGVKTYTDMSWEHPTVVVEQTISLAEYGLCNEVLEVATCPCGEITRTYTSNSCNWEHDPDSSTNGLNVSVCTDCSSVKYIAYQATEIEGSCQAQETSTVTYYRNGEEVYSFTNVYTYKNHDYSITEYELYGDSCEDGLYVVGTCDNCGNVVEDFVDYHSTINAVVTDLSEFDLCYDSHVQATCPCEYAYQSSYLEGKTHCSFMWEGVDEETGADIYVCSTCGATRMETTVMGEKDENCLCEEKTTIVYTDKNGNHIITGYSSWMTEDHKMETTYELLGDSCEDGVEMTRTCVDCGYSNTNINYDHSIFVKETYDLSAENLCFTAVELWGCACGKYNWVEYAGGQCSWSYVSGDENSNNRACTVCGVCFTETWEQQESIDVCNTQMHVTYSFTKDEKELLTFSFNQIWSNHRSVHEMTLLEGGTTCADGFMVKETCLDCGFTAEWGPEYAGTHTGYPVARETISNEQLCGDLELLTFRCGCGAETWQEAVWVDEVCEYGEGYYSEEYGTWVSACSKCGVEQYEQYNEVPVEGTTCQVEGTAHTVFLKDGVELFSYDRTYTGYSHVFICSFEMLGSTCADGFTISGTCALCGEQNNFNETHYGCDSAWLVERQVVCDSEDICGQVVLEQYSCPCGENADYRLTHNCSFEYVGQSADGSAIMKCTECGLQRIGSEDRIQESGSCVVTFTMDYTFVLNEETLGTVQQEYTRASHTNTYSFGLLGETCEDGYTLTGTCVYCDNVTNYPDQFMGHDTYLTEYYDLAEYGLCEGDIRRYSCACGQYSGWENYTIGCSNYYTGNTDPDTGLDVYECTQCGSEWYAGEVGTYDWPNCNFDGGFYAKFVKDGETLLNIADTYERTIHRYLATSMELLNPDGDCSDGYVVTMTCKYCGLSYTERNYGCIPYMIAQGDLSEIEGACGGDYFWNTCPCGQYSFGGAMTYCQNATHNAWQETGSDGIIHYYQTETCSDCGVVFTHEEYGENIDACHVLWHDIFTFTKDGEVIASVDGKSNRGNHNTNVTFELVDPNKSCEEGGVNVYYSCTNCDYSRVEMVYGHEQAYLESIDLTEYGSVCGGELVHLKCACGEENKYDFNDQKPFMCDLDRKDTEVWIAGAVNDDQNTTLGWVETNSYAYTYTCAVTDPQCGLKIRMARYWLVEDCIATQYETWQLGYDEATGTCQREITIATGSTHAYHAYNSSAINETLDDGTTVSGTLFTCTDCGSTYADKMYYQNGDTIKSESIAENTLNNGEIKYMYYTFELGVAHGGYRYETLNLLEHILADGTETWWKREYTYDFTNGCKGTCHETNSEGLNNTYSVDAHHNEWNCETTKDPTCTQYGSEKETWTCLVCNQITQENTYAVDPLAHSWSYDSTKATYVCSYCGLESINGASGSIVIEDLTADYGPGTDYVVGYWNRGAVEFIPSVSVILDDATEDAENELYLTGIEFTYLSDDIVAISCSKSAVQEAAAAAIAEAGYTGSYAIRISFVPVNSTDTLDYAITFDSQTTA